MLTSTAGPWSGGDVPAAVGHRTIVERAVPGTGGGRPGDGRGRIRLVDRIPAELVIADRRSALLPLASGADGSAALVVHPGALLDSLVDLFEDVWHEGRPLRPAVPASQGPDATDLEILSLLLAGLTDTSVARQLGLGLRTVQRRVRRMMELAGVTTRLQLGWHAAERGWRA
ncbi:helix-turn-helix transcriptional regulator [Streptomyces sp. NPDC049577]|uniref:helix-turn-helix transcriptional regulator n=1 Tax=Streptomyces sp. NPDC049577 TaxID=3155153 RepID=UPI0034372DA6